MLNERRGVRQLMDSCRGLPKVLAVTSGKGGVGKSNISANLAVCMAGLGKKVVLVDADLSLGNLDVLLNVESKYDITDVIAGRKNIEEIVQTGPEGIEVVCAGSGMEMLADINEFQRQRLVREMSRLQERSDAIVIDTAAGISKAVVGFCLSADQVLVVTTPEATAMTDAYAMIKVLAGNRYAGRISVVVNMAESVSEGKRVYQQIANVARRFLNIHIDEAGVVVGDERMGKAVRQRKPVVLAYPKADVSYALASLAARLCSGTSRTEGEGFFRKVVDWFF